ncbi:MAG: PAS domain-containing protein [Candidatus Sumerlaeia bacterium]|nr:PAS domain-containing protein [Candidatus Sumerlaeia bacterium]
MGFVSEELSSLAKAQLILRREHALLRGIVQTSAAAIIVCTVEGRILQMNDRARGFFSQAGVPFDGTTIDCDALELTDFDGNAPDRKDTLLELVRVRREPVPNIERRLGEGASARYLSINAAPLEGVEHEPSAVVLSIFDVTELVRAERELRRSENRLRVIFSSLEGAVGLIAPGGVVEDCNEFFASRFGARPADLIGASVYGRAKPEKAAMLRGAYERVFATGETLRGERVCDERRIEEFRLCPVHAPDGTVQSIVELAVDVTERKRAEEQRLALAERLKDTQGLEALAKLAGGIAHDFNNLLLAVTANADLALETLPDDSLAHESLVDIRRAADRATALCRQLLAYSGKGRFLIRPLDLDAIVSEELQLAARHSPRPVELDLELAGVSPVEGDESTLRQLIAQCAARLCEESGVLRVLTGRTRLAGGASAPRVFAGAPLGRGGYATLQFFDPSGQWARELAGPEDAVGLGAISSTVVRKIVQAWGASLAVEETPMGHRVLFLFPLREDETAVPAQTPLATAKVTGGTVLFVDDEAMLRETGAKMLRRLGFDPAPFGDGRDAARAVAAMPPGQPIACVIDITMPGMDGVETMKRIRELRPGVPVLLSSGYADAPVPRVAERTGPVEFLQKPYGLEELEQALSKLLGRASQ